MAPEPRHTDTDEPDWRDVWRARHDYRHAEPGGWRARRRARAVIRRGDRRARDAWRSGVLRRTDVPAGAVAVLAVVVAACGLWFAAGDRTRPAPPRVADTAPTVTGTAPTLAPPAASPVEPTGDRPPMVGPTGATRPTATGLAPLPIGVPDRRDATSVAVHTARDACSYAWTESVTGAFTRVTRWMSPAAASRWAPTAADRAYWSGHVVPDRETVACQVTGTTLDGPDTATRHGISVTLATTRSSRRAAERGVSSYAVLLDRRPGRTWVVTALTATG